MTASAEVALIRHGLPNRVEGVVKPDPDLTISGHAQARAVSDVLAALPVRTVASSELVRARQTAEPTATRLGIDMEIHTDLAEFSNGEDYYIPIEDMIAEADPRLDAWRALAADPQMSATLSRFQATATSAVARLAAGPGLAAVFCHGGVIGACVTKALGGARVSLEEPHYGSITRIVIDADGAWKLRTYNEIHHIERLTAISGGTR